MTVLSIREIYTAALSAGFTPHQAVTWTSIALAESGGNNKALNNTDPLAVSGLGAGSASGGTGQQGLGGALGGGTLPGLGIDHGSLLPAAGDTGSAVEALDHG